MIRDTCVMSQVPFRASCPKSRPNKKSHKKKKNTYKAQKNDNTVREKAFDNNNVQTFQCFMHGNWQDRSSCRNLFCFLSSQPTYYHDALSLDPTETFLERALDLPFGGVELIFRNSPPPLNLRIIPPFLDGQGGLFSGLDRMVSYRRRVRPAQVHFVFAQVPHGYDLQFPASSKGAVPDLLHPSLSFFLCLSIISGC